MSSDRAAAAAPSDSRLGIDRPTPLRRNFTHQRCCPAATVVWTVVALVRMQFGASGAARTKEACCLQGALRTRGRLRTAAAEVRGLDWERPWHRP